MCRAFHLTVIIVLILFFFLLFLIFCYIIFIDINVTGRKLRLLGITTLPTPRKQPSYFPSAVVMPSI